MSAGSARGRRHHRALSAVRCFEEPIHRGPDYVFAGYPEYINPYTVCICYFVV